MPEGEEEQQETENLFEKIMKEKFPNLMKEIDTLGTLCASYYMESQTRWMKKGPHQDTS